MRVMTIKQALAFMRKELGMDVSLEWLQKMAEPDADGRRRLPFFKEKPGKTAPLKITDDALVRHYQRLQAAAEAATASPGHH